MSKIKSPKGDSKRDERRKAQFAALQQRAAEAPAAPPRAHVEPVNIRYREEEYDPLLYAIESALATYHAEHNNLPIDADAERALRLLIARFEGDNTRRSGSVDVDGMAETVSHNIDLYFRRNTLLSRAEIIGCLRRIIDSVHTWHEPQNPRAYLAYIGDYVRTREEASAPAQPARRSSGLWVPGQTVPPDDASTPPVRSGGLWLPGDPV